MDLVLLLDLKAKVFDEYLHQRGGYVLQARVKGRNQPGIKLNEIHPGIQKKIRTVLNLIQHMEKKISILKKVSFSGKGRQSLHNIMRIPKMLIKLDHVLYSINYVNSSKIEALYMYSINVHSDNYLFLSTLNSALASFFLLALVFIDIQNSTANSSTNFLFIKVGNLRKINTNMKF